MKKLWILFLAAALCACSQEDMDIHEASGSSHCLFEASFEDDDVTRASIGNKDSEGKYPMVWNEGDNISVIGKYGVPYNEKLTLVNGAGTTKAKFDGDCYLDSDGYYLVYPYKKKNKPDHVIHSYDPYMPNFHWNGQRQTATKGSFDPKKGAMVAFSKDTDFPVSVEFKQVLSYIKFTTNYKCKSIIFDTPDSSLIACKDFTVKMDSNNEPDILWANSNTTTITMKAADDGAIEPGTYYIAVMPKTLSHGFNITFKSASVDWKEYRNSTSKSVTLQRGHVLNLGEFDLAGNLVELAGSGTSSDPYLVSDVEELQLVSTRVNCGKGNYNTAYFEQTADIDATGKVLTPIGSMDHKFSGHWSGNHHKVTNPLYDYVLNDCGYIFEFDTTYDYEYGLFGDIDGASIYYVTVENAQINGNGENNRSKVRNEVGMIVAHAFGSTKSHISGCKANGAFRLYHDTKYYGGAFHVGGIIGASNANILVENCESNITFENMPLHTADSPGLGGIMGYAGPVKVKSKNYHSANALVTIDRCRNNGDLGYYINSDAGNDSEGAVGGILGRTYDSTGEDVCIQVGNCVNKGCVYVHGQYPASIYTTYVGGIVGYNDSDGWAGADPEVFNCLNRGMIESNGTCFWTTIPDRVSWCGSIVGKTYDSDTKIHMCVHLGYFSFNVSDGKYSSTFCGKSGNVYNCFTYNQDHSVANLNNVLQTEECKNLSKVKWCLDRMGDLDLNMSL